MVKYRFGLAGPRSNPWPRLPAERTIEKSLSSRQIGLGIERTDGDGQGVGGGNCQNPVP